MKTTEIGCETFVKYVIEGSKYEVDRAIDNYFRLYIPNGYMTKLEKYEALDGLEVEAIITRYRSCD